tara:strand:- start:1169 stop:1558 length:390 start_codon:yes stop_codon:yes gene_type:complete
MCLFGIFIKKICFVLLMNAFKEFANNINQQVDVLEENITDMLNPENTEEEEELQEEREEEEKIEEQLKDPTINNIFSSLRRKFPSPTNFPVPSPSPAPKIEGFEDLEKTPIQKQINNQLKQKFVDNFKF